MNNLIQLTNIKKSYTKGKQTATILSNLNLKVCSGEMISITGRSGSGKSTLLNILAGLVPLDYGAYLFRDETNVSGLTDKELLSFRNNNIGYILQESCLIPNLTVYENIALPLKYSHISNKEIKTKVINQMKKLGIEDTAYQFANQISGGQSQRAAIARAIIKDASLILADEPTGALDVETEKKIMEIFLRLNKQGNTIIIVTHNIKIARMCNRILRIENGNITENDQVLKGVNHERNS